MPNRRLNANEENTKSISSTRSSLLKNTSASVACVQWPLDLDAYLRHELETSGIDSKELDYPTLEG